MNMFKTIVLPIFTCSASFGASVTLIDSGASGSPATYLLPTDDSVDGLWTNLAFDDSGWTPATFGAGVGTLDGGTLQTSIPDPGDVFSIYFRSSFNLVNAAGVTQLDLSAVVDDGVVIYINGEEIARDNVTGDPGTGNVHWDTLATTLGDEATPRLFDLSSGIPFLVDGDNVISFHIANSAPGSSDAGIIPTLTAEVIPEPSTSLLALLALIPVMARRRQ